MENFNRYKNTTNYQYDKKGIMYYPCRVPSDKKIIPLLCQIKNKAILDIGLGTGQYTKILLNENDVTGIDQNPHLCKLPIEIHKGDATQLGALLKQKRFDIIISTWMTEYLNKEQLIKFFEGSRTVLNDNGQLITTMISSYGFGYVYTMLAKLKGISKHSYTKRFVLQELKNAGFKDVEVIDLNSWLYIPWAYLVIAK